MFDFNSIVDDIELTTKFECDLEVPGRLNAFSSGEQVGFVDINGGTFEASDDNIFMQYKLWQTRPERVVGKKVQIEGKNMEQLIEIYEELFIGAYIITMYPALVVKEQMPFKNAIEWLRTTDFYLAPASTRYHDSNPGGLLIHSLNVYNKMIDLIEIDPFQRVNLAEATIAVLVHDWCKINFYEAYQRNVKNEVTGQWEKETAYKVNQKGVPLGHGVTSMYLASRIIRLTLEQALAIRWHMGEYNVAPNEVEELQQANAKHPLVYLLQFADRLACTEY